MLTTWYVIIIFFMSHEFIVILLHQVEWLDESGDKLLTFFVHLNFVIYK